MGLPDWAWYGPDDAGKLLVHVKALRERDVRTLVPALQLVARHFGPTGYFCMVTGRPPRRVPSGYCHLFVGEDLGWLPGRASAVAVPMTTEVHGFWEYRGAHIDTVNYSRTPKQLAEEIIHELEHVCGRPHDHPPWTMGQTISGLQSCALAARRHFNPGRGVS